MEPRDRRHAHPLTASPALAKAPSRGAFAAPGARAIALLALVLPPLFVACFVGAERTVYSWDYANYWLKVVDLTDRFRSDPLPAIAHALRSVTADKYNELAALPLLPATLWSGTGRVAYTVAVAVVFGVPTMLLLAVLVRRLAGARRDDPLPSIVALLAAALLPQLWFPVLVGGLDLVGCIPMLAVFLLLAPDPLALGPRRAFAVGLLLGILPLLRRWYAFFGVSLVVTYAAIALAPVLLARLDKRRGRRATATAAAGSAARSRRAAIAAVAMLGGAALAALPLTGPVLRDVFLRDHVFLHAPYRTTPGAVGVLWRAWMYFGSLTLAAAGIGFALAAREARVRRLVLLMGLQTVVLLLSFNLVQTFGANHFYLVVPALLAFVSLAIVRFVDAAASPRARRRRLAIAAGILALNFAMVLLPPLSTSGVRMSMPVTAVFGRVRLAPQQRTDLDAIARLDRAIAALRAERGGGSVYVLASSNVLNPEVLRNAHLALPDRSDVPDLRSAIAPGVHVDRRDGFPLDLLAADVVVTADPPQVHLAPEEQQVVLVPAAEIAAGTTIGRSFRTLPERFALDDGVVARLHVKEGRLDPQDVRALGERLLAAHGGAIETLRAPDVVVPLPGAGR